MNEVTAIPTAAKPNAMSSAAGTASNAHHDPSSPNPSMMTTNPVE